MYTLENSKESEVGIIVAEFERLCAEERSCGVEVERTIHNIDELTQRDVMHAEAELGAWRIECNGLRYRLQRALEGEYPSTTILD